MCISVYNIQSLSVSSVDSFGVLGNIQSDSIFIYMVAHGSSPTTSMAYLKLRITEEPRPAKEAYHKELQHQGTEEIPPPTPKKIVHGQSPEPEQRRRFAPATGGQQS
jgi:hypothetical protein